MNQMEACQRGRNNKTGDTLRVEISVFGDVETKVRYQTTKTTKTVAYLNNKI